MKGVTKEEEAVFAEMFWQRVLKRESGCWEWTGAIGLFGYGNLTFKQVSRNAHKVAYELVHGDVPAGMFVLHRCDNPPCCNPEHLYVGTQNDNMQDRARRGRAGIKLTTEQAKDIFVRCRNGSDYTTVAKEFGVTRRTIALIARRTTWKYATADLLAVRGLKQ